MILEFTLGNFRSFYARKTLSMVPASTKGNSVNTFKKGSYKCLATAAIYGANSSGKSNLLLGLEIMRYIVLNNIAQNSTRPLKYEPFLFNEKGTLEPTFYEVVFVLGGTTRYRYGFEADRSAVQAEWLFSKTDKSKEKPLFVRIKEGIDVIDDDFREGRGLEEKTRDNTLFLSVADSFNGPVSKEIMKWFSHLQIISGIHTKMHEYTTLEILGNKSLNEALNNFFADLNLGFNNLEMEKTVWKDTNRSFIKRTTFHERYDENGHAIEKVPLDATRNESSGTNKIIDIAGSLFTALQNGGVSVIDELDAKLHPLLTKRIVELFHSREINPSGAQLIFATHDTNLLSYCSLRKDQIYFVEKDHNGSSDLYSLLEFGGEEKINEQHYLEGRYGAIPFFGDFKKLLS
jgi:AAA15 family ATPase/GTPase